jgi:hypothetical protein
LNLVVNPSEVLPSDFYEARMAIDSTGIVSASDGGFARSSHPN